jgi:hypothetical protein
MSLLAAERRQSYKQRACGPALRRRVRMALQDELDELAP